mgnify:FL=1
MSTEHYSEPTRPTYVEDDEITLRELILKVQEFFQELVRNWVLIVAVVAVATVLFLANTYFKDTIYRAETTFLLNTSEGRSGGQLGGLLGQFGLGGGGGAALSPARIMELSKSRRIIQQVLFQRAEVDSTTDFFANHFIRVLELHDHWEGGKLEGLTFTQDSLPLFSREENSALRSLQAIITQGNEDFDPVLEFVNNESSGIMELMVRSTSEDLAYQFSEAMYEVMQDYYVQQSIEPQQRTYNAMQQKVDSLSARIAYLESALADYTDSNYGTYSASSQIRRGHLQRELTFTASAYGEAIKNTEVASFSLETAKPVFQLIDAPLLPLPKEKSSYLMAIVLGVALGGFLGVAFVLGRKIFRDVMAD